MLNRSADGVPCGSRVRVLRCNDASPVAGYHPGERIAQVLFSYIPTLRTTSITGRLAGRRDSLLRIPPRPSVSRGLVEGSSTVGVAWPQGDSSPQPRMKDGELSTDHRFSLSIKALSFKFSPPILRVQFFRSWLSITTNADDRSEPEVTVGHHVTVPQPEPPTTPE